MYWDDKYGTQSVSSEVSATSNFIIKTSILLKIGILQAKINALFEVIILVSKTRM